VTVPEACDKEMLRDGIVAKPPDNRLGEKAWWLCQIIENVNPRVLLHHLKLSEQQLLDAFAGTEWNVALLRGLIDAVSRFRDCDFANQLLQSAGDDYAERLFALLEKPTQEAFLARNLETRSFLLIRPVQNYYDSQAVNMLMQMRYPWSPEFSKAMLRTLRTHITQKNNFIFLDHIMRHISMYLDVDIWSAVHDSWATTANYHPTMERLINNLVLRKEMRDALLIPK
jgi:hypothetical protein